MNNPLWGLWIAKSAGISGLYDTRTKAIAICEQTPYQEAFTIKHETGHYIWFNLITDSQRIEYAHQYERDKNYKERFYREYSTANVFESFADDYALSQLPRKYKRPNSVYFNMRMNLIKGYIKELGIQN